MLGCSHCLIYQPYQTMRTYDRNGLQPIPDVTERRLNIEWTTEMEEDVFHTTGQTYRDMVLEELSSQYSEVSIDNVTVIPTQLSSRNIYRATILYHMTN